MSRNYISHYGVPGMKWRFTKYTNKIRKGGKDVYEYFTKTGYTKRQQNRLNNKAIKDSNGNVMGYRGKTPVARTQFQRDFRKATKPLRKSWNRYYKNTLSPAIRRFKTAAPVKLQKLQYRLGGLKGKLISRLKGYTGGGGPSNIRSLDARTVKNARMTDYSNAKFRNTTYKPNSKNSKYWRSNGSPSSKKSSQSDYSKHYKYKRNRGAGNPYWGRK